MGGPMHLLIRNKSRITILNKNHKIKNCRLVILKRLVAEGFPHISSHPISPPFYFQVIDFLSKGCETRASIKDAQ
jgi:hypothetical protein